KQNPAWREAGHSALRQERPDGRPNIAGYGFSGKAVLGTLALAVSSAGAGAAAAALASSSLPRISLASASKALSGWAFSNASSLARLSSSLPASAASTAAASSTR